MVKFNKAVPDAKGRYSVVSGTPTSLKKMTGTRLSKALGVNHWADDFQAWCEIMKVAEPPFDGTKYTEAGKAIEPKLIAYCKDVVSPYIVSPDEYYTDKKMRFDFFPDNDVFGGMWDALAFARPDVTMDDDDTPMAVIEAKTTSRPQDWEDGVPDNYAIQGLLYAYLLDVEDVYFPVAFLEPSDYDDPYAFECTPENTRVYHLNVNEPVCGGRWSNFTEVMFTAIAWYEMHILGNISPEPDERKDKDYLEILGAVRPEDLNVDVNNLDELCNSLKELDELVDSIEEESGLKDIKKKQSAVKSAISSLVIEQLSQADDADSIDTEYYSLKKSLTRSVNYDKIAELGLTDELVNVKVGVRVVRKK